MSYPPPFTSLDLPFPILVHSIGLLGLGLHLAFLRRGPFDLFAPPPTTARAGDLASAAGLATAALGLLYLGSGNMPRERNQLLHASVPMRIVLAGVVALVLVVNGRKMTKRGFWELAALGAYDSLGALWLGWELGRFDGVAAL